MGGVSSNRAGFDILLFHINHNFAASPLDRKTK